MDIDSATLLYFSPTRTTRQVLEGIAQGMQLATVEHVDLTPPEVEVRKPAEMHTGLAVIGAPVYGGRLPAYAVSRLRRIKGNGAPAVVVVVYGNRAYEDALLELRDLAVEIGFKPVAAGAFIGEHSFSTNVATIAAGRPDAKDLRKAREFGETVRDKMRSRRTLDGTSPLRVPGNSPYKEWRGLSNIAPVTRETECAKCEQCASVCPTAAIVVREAVLTDPAVCIRCCACVKACSTGARVMDDPRIRQVAEHLSTNCCLRKEPEMYYL